MPLTGKERAALRADAHHLTAAVHVGQHGLTRPLLQTLDDVLRTRELVKIQVGRNSPFAAKEAAARMAGEMGAEVVQVIGKTVTLYRENPDLTRREGAPPPWR
ncbi:MAG: ribosome assembly RNA-binding protein YhbY [Gemmatimonadaceae bacterium]